MKHTWMFYILWAFLAVVVNGLPVTQPKKEEPQSSSAPPTPDVETALEYERYLKEVVEALESDPEFRKKLDKAPEADIRSGKIAQELDYVNHHVRTKLDEIKRREIERLRSLANKQFELSNDIDRKHLKVPAYLDHDNQHTFEIDDLQKLIKKTSEDLAEADRLRREEFKEYEMQKQFERENKLKELDEEHRKKYEHDLKEQEEKHKKHEKVHHPGNKAQLEEVWEKQDHMDKQDFNPRAFFMMHDLDENGFWDEVEVKALFVKELDKVYQSGLPEDDMRERAEEMERMREHVFKEADTNHDDLISYQEFLDQTKREEFNKDPEWATVDEQPQYTHEEYLEFERRRQEEIQRLIAQGQLPPHPNMPQGYYPNDQHPSAYQQHPGAYQQHPGAYQQHPAAYQQHPSAYQQQPNIHYQNQPQQHQAQQPYQQPPYQGQQPVQQVQFQPNQVYQVQSQPQVMQQQQAIPQGQPMQQQVPQGQPMQQQVPQGQAMQNQVPQGQPIQQQAPQGQQMQPQIPQQQPMQQQQPVAGQPSVQAQPKAQAQVIKNQPQVPQNVPVAGTNQNIPSAQHKSSVQPQPTN